MCNAKRSVLVLALVAFVVGLAFAGGAEAPPDEVELTVWGVRDEYLLDLDEWYEENPDIRIEYEVVPWERHLEQLLLTAGTARAPDIASLDLPWVAILADLGHLLALDDYVAQIPQDDRDDITPAMWDFPRYEGDLYAFPFTTFGRALFYRADWFEEAGLSHPPETWEDVVIAAQELQDPANDIWGLSVRGRTDDGTTQGWLPIFYAMGGEFVDEIPQIDSEAGVQALELYRALTWDYEIMSPDTVSFGSGEARGLFIAGQAVMSIIGSHIAPAVVEGGTEYGDFKLAHIPRLDRDDPVVNMPTTFQWAILSNSEHPDEAMKFIQYLSRTEGQFEYSKGYMEAVRASVYDMPEYHEAKPWASFMLEDQAVSSPLPRVPQYAQMSDIIQDALQEMLGNPDANASEVAAETQRRIDELFD